jgi:hypothetical protein
MNTDNCNKALDKLAFYRRMAVLGERGTPAYTTYIDKLEAGTSILAIASGKVFDEVDRDVREAYDSKYVGIAG